MVSHGFAIRLNKDFSRDLARIEMAGGITSIPTAIGVQTDKRRSEVPCPDAKPAADHDLSITLDRQAAIRRGRKLSRKT